MLVNCRAILQLSLRAAACAGKFRWRSYTFFTYTVVCYHSQIHRNESTNLKKKLTHSFLPSDIYFVATARHLKINHSKFNNPFLLVRSLHSIVVLVRVTSTVLLFTIYHSAMVFGKPSSKWCHSQYKVMSRKKKKRKIQTHTHTQKQTRGS